jgi:hypothetical protein
MGNLVQRSNGTRQVVGLALNMALQGKPATLNLPIRYVDLNGAT